MSAGGDDGVRTHDPLLAGQVLSQLSYTPIFWGFLFLNEQTDIVPFLSRAIVLCISLTLTEPGSGHCPYGHSKLNNNESHTRLQALSRRLFGFGLF